MFAYLGSALLALLLLAATAVHADYDITAPVANAALVASTPITVQFTDNGNVPTFAEMALTRVLLCTGPNSAIHCFDTAVGTFTPSASLTSYSANLAPLAAMGSNGPYYFQFYSTTSGSGYSIEYSQRFTLTGMTGSYRASSGGDTDPPTGSTNLGGSGGGPSQEDLLSLNQVPYSLQTGATRYAPVQQQPGTRVTHRLSASQRFPTSSVSLFTTYTMRPLQRTTYTPSWTYTITQAQNYAATQPSPTGYYAASEALSRSIAAKAKRGRYDL